MMSHLRVFRAGIRAQQHCYTASNRSSLAGFNFRCHGWDDDGTISHHHFPHNGGQSFSTMTQSLLDDEKKKNRNYAPLQQQKQLQQQQQQQQQQRTYLPLIIGVAVAVGWVAYRKSQGKPLTPDQAMAAEDDFKKHQEKLRRQREEFLNKDHNEGDKQEHKK